MDHQFYGQPQQNNRRSQKMETTSFIFGILAVTMICLVYPTFIFGSLSIVFALLSRGGEMTLTPKARTGLLLGSVGLGIIILMFVYTIVVANVYFGGIDEMMREMYQSIGLDYDAILSAF